MIDISKLDKAAVLAALYNRAKPQGWGYLDYQPGDMTIEQAREHLAKTTSFDYIQGRVLKINLGKAELDPWGYDRDNGQGAAQRAIDALRERS